jgi:hypothetical protein
MQQLVAEAEAAAASAAAAAAGGYGAASGSAAAAVTGLSLSVDPPVPVQRFRVSGVLPRFSSSSSSSSDAVTGLTVTSSSSSSIVQDQQQHGQAIVKAWRSAEVVQQLEEGLVVLAVALTAGNEGRSSTVDLGGMGRPMVELSTSNITRYGTAGPAAAAAAVTTALRLQTFQRIYCLHT